MAVHLTYSQIDANARIPVHKAVHHTGAFCSTAHGDGDLGKHTLGALKG